VRAAAIQLAPVLGDVEANLDACWRLGTAAAAAGAELIVLPEFFTTGVGFVPELAERALPPDGAATALLVELARRRHALAGGSFLCRDADGHARNAFVLAGPDGVLGRHDKDLPTMWENCFYVGGTDDGVIQVDGSAVGVALCWEFMRTQTARRLRGRVQLVVGGSCWWSIPPWPPRELMRRAEVANARLAAAVAPAFAGFAGAPVVHAAHCGAIGCGIPWLPARYRGHYQGGAVIADAHGHVVARRDAREGPGFALGEITPVAARPTTELPDRFWLHRRGALAAFFWHYQRLHGRRWYARHAAGRPPYASAWRPPAATRPVARAG
jgi:predicted amidohydrolase